MENRIKEARKACLLYTSLCDLDALVEVAADTGYIKAEDKERILKFRDNPSDEGWMKGDK